MFTIIKSYSSWNINNTLDNIKASRARLNCNYAFFSFVCSQMLRLFLPHPYKLTVITLLTTTTTARRTIERENLYILHICNNFISQRAVLCCAATNWTETELFVCLSVRLFAPPSVRLSLCLSACPTVCQSVRPSVYLFLCLSVSLTVCLPVRLSVCLFVHNISHLQTISVESWPTSTGTRRRCCWPCARSLLRVVALATLSTSCLTRPPTVNNCNIVERILSLLSPCPLLPLSVCLSSRLVACFIAKKGNKQQ